MHPSTRAAALLFAPLVVVPSTAMAAEEYGTYRSDVSDYPVEIEPHFSFGPENVYGASGYGAGLRLGLPLVSGAIGRVPDNLALSLGGDILHYDNCYFRDDCGANYLMVPIAAQWNIFVARRVSLLAEGGVFIYKGFFDGCRPGDGPGCAPPSDFGILPTLAVGLRVHLGPAASLTARLGYPTTTLGVSFF
ncbi:MAG TPA: hypothetical protein VKU41_22460 [Polyangiaceae bacterium]|nr:hypothetical protein [Polyangiaceae bacterium]